MPAKMTTSKSSMKRKLILEAALDNFIEKGFTASRVEDIAKAAHVAKGTVYLYFTDKNTLFEEAIRNAVAPFFSATREQVLASVGTSKQRLLEMLDTILNNLLYTKMHHVLRLLISEGLRFPALVSFYHQEFLAPHFQIFTSLFVQAAENGELVKNDIAKYPHLITAPIIMGIIWQALFGELAPVDTKGMLMAQLDLLFK